MKQKLFKKLACLALSGILSVSGVEIPAYASEISIMKERTEIQTETTAEGTTETSGESTEISDELTETEVVPTETSDESTESETMEEKTTETETDEETTETETDEETTETETEMAEKMTARTADEDGNVPTPQEAYEAMIALQSKFPEGMHWTDASSGTYTWKGGRGENGEIATMGTGCVNFAFQLSDAAFGTLPARMLKENEFEFADIHVGDILRISLGHSVIVLQVNDDSMVIAEGNYNQSIHWGRVVTKSEVEQSVHVLTRYPKGYIPPNNPDADTVIKEDSIQDDEGNPSGLQWKLTKSGTLTISGNGDMPDFNFGNPSVSNRPWNDNIGSIQKIIIEDGVTSIGSNAFRKCDVYSVSIPKSVKKIGNNAFRECRKISYVYLEGVVTIGERAFQSCDNIRGVTLPACIKEIGSAAFFQCQELVSVGFDPKTQSVTVGDDIFNSCWRLMDVTLPKTMNQIGKNMFYSCMALPGLIIPEGVTSIGEGAFTNCSYMTTVFIPKSVKQIGIAAFAKSGLTTVYYGGSEAEWKNIQKIGDTAATLSKVTLFCDIDPEPRLTPDTKTVYKVGEAFDKDGSRVNIATKTISLSDKDVTGFDSKQEGVTTIAVTLGKDIYEFDLLVVEEPSLTAKQGQKLEELTLPSNNYGTWSWSEDSKQTALTETGSYDYPIIFTPKDTEKFSVREDLQAHIKVQTTAQDPGNPEEGLWIAPIAACTYTGIAVTPSVNVFYNDKKLTAGIDYTLLYQNNIKAATSDAQKAPTVIVKGKGNYAGTKKETFTIDKLTLTKDHLKIAANYPKNIKYTPIVTNDSNNILKAGRDYTLTYQNSNGEPLKKQPTTEGTYQIQIQGIGSCAGDFKYSYSISESGGATAINKGTAKIDSFTYGNGEPKVSLTVNDNTLISGTDYIVNFVNVGKKGTATATFIGIGNYTGTLKKNFKVQAAPIEENDISVPQTAAYAKGGAKPNVTVTVNGRSLVMNTDYTVLYKNNKKVGNIAKVVIKGKGNYSGSVTKMFSIEQQSLRAENIKIYVSDAQAGKNPAVTVYDANGKKLAVKSDYRTEIDKEKRKVTITAGKNGLYKDSVDKDYKELPKKQLVTSVTLKKTQPKSFEYTGKEIKLEQDWLTVKAGKTELGKNEFEIIGYVNNIQKGTATVIIKGCGEYGGIKMYNYKIKSKKLSQK